MAARIASIFLLAIFSFGDCAPPSFITPCKHEDIKCLQETTKQAIPIFTQGLPEYGVDTLDPMYIKSINATQGNLVFLLNDATATGLKNCELKKIERNQDHTKIFLRLMCSAKLEGDYILKGSVLFVPLEGNGKLHAQMKSVLFNVDVDLDTRTGKDGKKHWHVKSWSHTYEFKEKSDVVFENLYDGNEVLGRAARELISNNGNEIIKEIGSPVVKAFLGKVVKNINNFFKAVAMEDLIVD